MSRDDDRLVAASRFLAYVLRHRPDAAGLRLDDAGWADVDAALAALAGKGHHLGRDGLARLVAGTDKRRFELDGDRIRAAQGHSVDVDLGLEAVPPPDRLYHGTVERFLDAILRDGLLPRGRTHVHLSADVPTARLVGARRGTPVVLVVEAAAAHRDGHVFHRAVNGVWLTERVPPRFLARA